MPALGPRHPVRFAPSLLSADFADIRAACRTAEAAGAEILHLDVMDGCFVPNLTFGPLVVEAVRRCTGLYLDVHLMIVQPDLLVPAFRQAGADGITVHAEACPHLERSLAHIRSLGARAGVALNPATSESAVDYVWDSADLILAMTVNPGFGGQAFLPRVLEKVRRLRASAEARAWSGHIEVDGGVCPETAGAVVAAGADTLVSGSAFYGRPDPVAACRAIRAAAAVQCGPAVCRLGPRPAPETMWTSVRAIPWPVYKEDAGGTRTRREGCPASGGTSVGLAGLRPIPRPAPQCTGRRRCQAATMSRPVLPASPFREEIALCSTPDLDALASRWPACAWAR